MRPAPKPSQRTSEDLADPVAWVQRRVRMLEDVLHLAAPGGACRLVKRIDRRALPADLAAAGSEESSRDPGQRGLAAAGFAHQAECAPRGYFDVGGRECHPRCSLSPSPQGMQLADPRILLGNTAQLK